MTQNSVRNTWQDPKTHRLADRLPAHGDWLIHPGSLTERLQARFPNQIAFHFISEGFGEASDEECEILGLEGEKPWIRKIEWRFCGELWIAARTVIPRNALTPHLRQLGAESIGSHLFQSGIYRRGRIQVANLLPDSDFFRRFEIAAPSNGGHLWGRRSLFRLKTNLTVNLLVSEVFFPAFAAWVQRSGAQDCLQK